MADKMLKGTLLVSLMLVLAIGAPAMARAETTTTPFDIGDMFGGIGDLEGFMGVLPGFFGGMGGAGEVIGQIFSLLLPQFMNLSASEMIPGFYVLNATAETVVSSSVELATGQDKVYYADYDFYQYSQTDLQAAYGSYGGVGYPYCVVNRSGTGYVNITKTTGMSITIGIWDADKTLINTIERVVTTVKRVMNMIETEKGFDAAMEEAISSILYLLIHINDIITGDELIIVNPITYEYVRTNGSFGEDHAWKIDTWVGNVKTVYNMASESPAILADWVAKASSDNNGFMSWLLSPGFIEGSQDTTWGRFSFDLIQLWLKRFYVSIDVAEIVNLINGVTGGSGSMPNPAKILKDLDIEFYILWHHLMGGVFYNDTLVANDKIDVSYKNVTYPNGTVVTTPEGAVVQRPDSSEVTHLIGMKTMDSVTWNDPKPSTDKSKVSWGVRFNNMKIFWTPVGMDPEDRARNNPPTAILEFMDLGFTFVPGANVPLLNTDGTPSGKEGKDGQIKLDQHFGRWVGALQPWQIDGNLTGLDFAMVYISTLVHVHFTGQLLEKLTQGTGDWNEANNEGYVDSSKVEENHELKFGAGSTSSSLMVGKVDIAGPGYDIYEWSAPTVSARKPASTQIIPVALFTLDAQAGMSYTDKSMSGGGFDAAAMLGVEFSVMLYSVNYPEFSNSTYNGGKIWHDPTFSIFMTFEAGTYWAIILLVGVVALVGIAAILITRSKNNR